MDHQQHLQIANRIHLGLLRELGQGIDVQRLLDDALYARDVLLVCAAHEGDELQRLGRQFSEVAGQRAARRALRDAASHAAAEAGTASRQPAARLAGSPRQGPGTRPVSRAPAARRWSSPSSWFGA